MKLLDVNILLYVFDSDAPLHAQISDWLGNALEETAVALCDPVVSGFLRIATHPRILEAPATFATAAAFIDALEAHPNCQRVAPGGVHWNLFIHLCKVLNASGNDVPDMYLAALALERDCDLVSADNGFGRVPGLKWRNPLDR